MGTVTHMDPLENFSLVISSLTHELLESVLFNLQIFVEFLNFLLFLFII